MGPDLQFDDLPDFFGEYVIEDELGRGAMKIVIRALDPSASRYIALAILKSRFPSEEERERFARESRAITALCHPNIVKIYRSGCWEGQPFFTMELISGGSVADRLRAGPLPANEIQRILLPVCDAVSHAHRSGVLHRDLKPENLLLTDDDLPKVTDFGLSKDLNDEQGLTRFGQGLGTAYYVAPEQLRGVGVSAASDVYSLGMTLLEMMLGRSKFLEWMKKEPDPVNVLNQATKSDQWLNMGYPEALVTACLGCIQADPQDRYPNVDKLLSALYEAFSASEIDVIANTANANATPSGCAASVEGTIGARANEVLDNRFRLVALLDRGGMGEVWKAYDTKRKQSVSIKILPAEMRKNLAAIEKLESSFRAVSKLQHSHICSVHDLCDDQRVGAFIVMRYVDGINLAQLCQRRWDRGKPFEVAEVCQLLYPIADALDYTHQQGVMHRDVKPDNIMVTEEGGYPQLIDFGIAEEIRSTTEGIARTEEPAGTLRYLAPEIWRGERVEAKSDQYSLGVVSYELLSGEPPYGSVPTGLLAECVCHHPVPALNLPNGVNEVLRKVLSKSPGDRYANCRAFVEALRISPHASEAEIAKKPISHRASVSLLKLSGLVSFAMFLGFVVLQLDWRGSGDDLPSLVGPQPPEPFVDPLPPSAEILKQDSKSRQAREAYDRGNYLLSQNELTSAVAAFDEAIMLDSEMSEAYVGRGIAHMRQYNLELAIQEFTRAIEIDESQVDAMVYRSNAWQQQGLYESAIDGYTAALSVAGDRSDALYGRGQANRSLKLYGDAIIDFTGAIQINPKYADALEARGLVYCERELFELALADFRSALAIDDTRLRLRAEIARCIKNLEE